MLNYVARWQQLHKFIVFVTLFVIEGLKEEFEKDVCCSLEGWTFRLTGLHEKLARIA
jgi:hypothetical protein